MVVACPGFLLGPGDVHRVSTWPISAYLSGRLRFTVKRGLSFTDVRDVAQGVLALADRGRSGERTILTALDGNLDWPDLFALIADVSGTRRRTIPLPSRLALGGAKLAPWLVKPGEVRAASFRWHYSPAKAIAELGFQTRPLADTIADTIADHDRAGRGRRRDSRQGDGASR